MKPLPEIRERSDLPNQDGFKFIAVLWDGTEQVCKVIRRHRDGMHKVRGVKYTLIKGWKPIKKENK